MCEGVRAVGYVAEVDGRVVGQLGGDLNAVGRAGLGMAILDGYRSMGIGSGLLEAFIGWARERGAHKVELSLWPWNDRARRLYEKFGFELEGTRRRHWRRNDGSLWDDLSMGLVLDEDAPGAPPDRAVRTGGDRCRYHVNGPRTFDLGDFEAPVDGAGVVA